MGYKTYNCPVNKRCGACSWLNVPYPIQLQRKQEQIRELLGKFGPVSPILGMEEPLHYRNKLIVPFAPGRGGRILYGMYQQGSHRIVPSRDCVVTDPEAEAIVAEVARLMPQFGLIPYDEDKLSGFLRHAVVRSSAATGEIMLTLVCAGSSFPNQRAFLAALRESCPRISSIVMNVNTRNTNAVLGKQERVLWGRGYIEDELCGCRFRVSSQSFFQTNHAQTQLLYSHAVESAALLPSDVVLDAYCGIGTIGIIAAQEAGQVLGVESNQRAVEDARINARLNGCGNIRFIAQDATAFMLEQAKDGARADVVFMDPPRAGSTPDFINALRALGPSRVVYISCNPLSLARDLPDLVDKGYRVRQIQPVDMFPHTPHVETVVSLSKHS